MQKGFWAKLASPIIGLSPMDGVTDAPMRFIAKKHGQPDIIYTEFVSVEGLWRIQKRGEMDHKIWKELNYDENERPVIAQIFGSEPESFYEAAKIICGLGFDGIDINMGCPSPGLERRGGGAGLIRDKCNAGEVIAATRKGVEDFFNPVRGLQKTVLERRPSSTSADPLRAVFAEPAAPSSKKSSIPVSVKTRIGSSQPDQSWWEFLAGQNLPAVAMHGRTFKQLYSGEANWEELFKAGEIIRESGALFLGNGDVRQIRCQMTDGRSQFGVVTNFGKELDLMGKMDGVLIGRGAIGNPWSLRRDGYEPTIEERLKVAVEHTRKYEEIFKNSKNQKLENSKQEENAFRFFPMRKHLVGYANNFPLAGELRRKLVMTENADAVEEIVKEFLKG